MKVIKEVIAQVPCQFLGKGKLFQFLKSPFFQGSRYLFRTSLSLDSMIFCHLWIILLEHNAVMRSSTVSLLFRLMKHTEHNLFMYLYKYPFQSEMNHREFSSNFAKVAHCPTVTVKLKPWLKLLLFKYDKIRIYLILILTFCHHINSNQPTQSLSPSPLCNLLGKHLFVQHIHILSLNGTSSSICIDLLWLWYGMIRLLQT